MRKDPMPDTETNYEENQQLPSWIVLPLMCLIILLFSLGGINLGSLVATAILLLVLFFFGGLTTRVDAISLNLSFGIGVIRKSVLLKDIESAVSVKNRWWYGFGIRLTPHGWMWNMKGLSAIEITYKTGKKFRVGTTNPEGLLAALR